VSVIYFFLPVLAIVAIYKWMICVKIIKCIRSISCALIKFVNFFRLTVSILFYYCIVTFVDCMHLYDFDMDKNAS